MSSEAIATLAGAVIGGAIGILGSYILFKMNWRKESEEEVKRVAESKRRIASALLAEVIVLRDRYLEAYRIMDWSPGHPLMLGSFEGANLFAVYDGNADKLGLFNSQDAKAVVRAYTLVKVHLESFNKVDEESRSFTHRVPEYAATDNPIGKDLLAQLQRYQDRVGPMLQKESTLMLNAVDEARQVLERYAGG